MLARSCEESAVAIADAHKISSFDMLHLDSSVPVLRIYSGTILLLVLFICNGVLVFLVLVFTFQFIVYTSGVFKGGGIGRWPPPLWPDQNFFSHSIVSENEL